MGFLGKLLGFGGENPAERTVEGGKSCQKCGEPVPLDNMAFDSGSGGPIHRKCPPSDPGPEERPR